MLNLDTLADCAFHIANTIIRHDARGDAAAADRAHERLAVMLDTHDDDLVLTLARRLGRKRATAVMITPETIELACRAK